MKALETLAKQLAKNVERQPGWAYLLALSYVVLSAAGVPSRIGFGEWSLRVAQLPTEVWAIILTFLSYQLGDALDKVTFRKLCDDGIWQDRYEPQGREDVRQRLGISQGTYLVSMKIIESARQAALSVHVLNEVAKVLRSLVIPVALVAVIVTFRLGWITWIATILVTSALTAVIGWYVYPKMKTRHITNLYRTISSMTGGELVKLAHEDVGRVRLFFWEGNFIASGNR